jgi:uncharacterized protein YndB with AHSA1/START domain
MQVTYKSDFPVTDAACKKATGRTMKEWFKALEAEGDLAKKRRDAINWLHAEMNKDLWWCTTVWVEYERALGVVRKDGLVEGYNICVTKTIAAPIADVYAAWIDPGRLRKWFGLKCQADARNDGTFDDGCGNSGDYLRVRDNKDLRMTWSNPDAESTTRVDVAFVDKGKGKTGITLNHQRIQNRREADGLRLAWADAFEKLKQLLES